MRYCRPLLIINPRAGRGGTARTVQRHAEKFFAGHGVPCDVRVAEGSSDAFLWSQSAGAGGYDLVIVAGGDGTLRQAAAGIRAGTRLPLAILPTGSANLLAQDLGVPLRLPGALSLIAAGEPGSIDVGTVDSHHDLMLTAATVGYGSRIFEDARREFKQLIGFPAYVLAALKNVIRVPTAHFTCALDGVERAFDAQMVLVTNTSLNHFRPLHFDADIRVDDGFFDVFVFSHETFVATAEIIIGMALKRSPPTEHLAHIRVRSATITATPTLPVAVDGEAVHGDSITVAVAPSSLDVVRG